MSWTLKYCKYCKQMKNHYKDTCLKCNKKSSRDLPPGWESLFGFKKKEEI